MPASKSDIETLREHFLAMQQQLYQKEKALLQLQHDLKTPLTSIQLIAEFMLNNQEGDITEERKQLGMIVACCQQINQRLEQTPVANIPL